MNCSFGYAVESRKCGQPALEESVSRFDLVRLRRHRKRGAQVRHSKHSLEQTILPTLGGIWFQYEFPDHFEGANRIIDKDGMATSGKAFEANHVRMKAGGDRCTK